MEKIKSFAKRKGKRMYKELIISAIVAIVILGLNTITQNYTQNAVDQMQERLSKTRQELVKEEADFETAKKASKEAFDKWEELDDTIALYIEHAEIEKVKTAVISMQSFIEMKDDSQAVDSIDRCQYILENIKRREEFSIDNIF